MFVDWNGNGEVDYQDIGLSLAMAEEESNALCGKVASYLAVNGSDVINNDEFARACVACGVDPSSITQADLNYIQDVLNKTT